MTIDIHKLISRTIYNHYKLFNKKSPIQKRKEGSERNSIITKDIGLKNENLIYEDDRLGLKGI